MKSRRRPSIYIVLFLAWLAFAAWQYNEYRRHSELAREILHRQSHSIMNALVGGIRSHCRLGRFVREQLQGVLDELVESDDVLAVAISNSRGRWLISAGDLELIPDGKAVEGNLWTPGGYLLTEPFGLTATPEIGAGRGMGRGLGAGMGRGFGSGRGLGSGRGMGRGPGMGLGRTWLFDDAREESRSPESGLFDATLLLDRGPVDALCRIALLKFIWAIVGGAVVVICAAAAWAATVRLVEARGHADVLEIEARHLRELSQAATGLAHETRNPLGLVRGWTQQLAQSGLESAEDHAHARAVVEECDRITVRINQFLSYAKPCNPSLATVRIREIADELAMLLQPDLEAGRVVLNVNIDDLAVRADREMLRQTLFNLLQNAIGFSPPDNTVEVSAALRQDGAWRIEVSDRGPGVPAENVDSLFMPYFTTRADGTGLGLAIVSRIAAAHGWKIEYRPRAGGGAVFRLSSGG